MAIKHIKNIQAKAAAADSAGGGAPEPSSGVGGVGGVRQCGQVDPYKEGYHECLVTAVQYLLEISAHFEEICMKMANHLKGHFNDVMKGELCANSSTTFNHNMLGNFHNQVKRRQRDNGSPPTTTTGGLGQFLFANGVSLTEGRGGVGVSAPTGPRIAHLSGSINGHSSNGSAGVGNELKNGASGTTAMGGESGGCGGTNCEGVPSSSDGQEMNCAKDLSCRGANKNNNKHNNNSAQAATTSTNTSNGTEPGVGEGNGVVGGMCRKAPQQTPVITSTASTSACSSQTADLLVHAETESSCSVQDHGCGMDASASGGASGLNGHGIHAGNLVKVHNLTDTSCDGVEHHYKYKNYMQQRFSHERYHDEHVVSNSSNELHDHHDHPMPEAGPVMVALSSVGNRARGAMAPPPVEPTDSNCSEDHFAAFNAKRAVTMAALEAIKNGIREREEMPMLRDPTVIKEEKMDTASSPEGGAVGTARMNESSQQTPRLKSKSRLASVPVPIFALHSQGAFYIPLTVDYDALMPYMAGVNLFDKNLATMKALHPVNINIYAPY